MDDENECGKIMIISDYKRCQANTKQIVSIAFLFPSKIILMTTITTEK